MLAVLVVILAVGGAYVQSLGGPFLWDDRALVVDAPLVERSQSLAEYLRHPFWMGGGAQARDTTYYRPLVTLSFALDHRLHGVNPGGYHLTNIVLHVACALLLLGLLRRAGVREGVAALVVCAFALLPRLAEAAAWISGRTDLLATLFVLGALRAWGPGLSRRCLSGLFFGVALLAKESALALVPALAVAEWLRAETGKRSLARVTVALTPLLTVLALYVALRLALVGFDGGAQTLGIGRRALVVLQSIGTYAAMLLDPLRPRAVIGRIGAISRPSVAFGVVTLAGVAFTLVRYGRRLAPGTASALALSVGALLPVLHVVPIPLRTLAADRFLYLPAAALALAAGPALDAWLGARPWRFAVAAAATLALGVTTLFRVAVWSDELEFWAQTYLETPHVNSAPATELFGVFYRAGLYADGLTLAERALRYDDPNKKDPLYNSALCLARLGSRTEAARRFEASRSTRHALDANLQLAILELQAGRVDRARELLETLTRAGDPGGRVLLGRLPALEHARAELQALPAGAEPALRARLATVIGDDPTALRAWKEAVSRPDVSKATLNEALRYLVRTGDLAALEMAARAHLTRYGPLEPELAGIVDVRLGELERLIAARPRLGLDGSLAAVAPLPSR